MKYRTPDDMITSCTQNIKKFLSDGMQNHAVHELESTIDRINTFHKKRSLQNEISRLDSIVHTIKTTSSIFDDVVYGDVLEQLNARKSVVFDELEKMK